MNARARLERLERGAGVGSGGAPCACPDAGDVRVWRADRPDERDESPPRLCDRCGRHKRVLVVNLVRVSRRQAL